MSTTFTKAVKLTTGGTVINFGKGGTRDDGSAFTIIVGVKVPTSHSGSIIFCKDDAFANNVGYHFPLIANYAGASYADVKVARATSLSLYRENPLLNDATYTWLVLTIDRTTGIGKIYKGDYVTSDGSGINDVTGSDVNGGSGVSVSDSSYDLVLGSNGTQVGITDLEVFFFGKWNSQLSVATVRTYCSDMDGSGKSSAVLYCKAAATDTASLADTSGSGFDGAYTGTVSVVAGPDTGGGGGNGRLARNLLLS